VLLVRDPLEEPLLDQAVEALREDVAADPEVALEVLEALDAEEGVAQDERCPPVAQQVHRTGDRARPRRERGALHQLPLYRLR